VHSIQAQYPLMESGQLQAWKVLLVLWRAERQRLTPLVRVG
jgi:hypothetical protein